jgi:hypothetical protein
MKSEKGRSEPNIERRNRKDVHIDQYGVDRQHEQSGGNRDRGKRGKRDEKEEHSDMQVCSKEGKEKRGESEGKGGK